MTTKNLKFKLNIPAANVKAIRSTAKRLLKEINLDKLILQKAKKASDFIDLQASLIQPGFAVELKSGGPAMTVESKLVANSASVGQVAPKDQSFVCVYYNGAVFERIHLPATALKLISR